MPQEVARRRSVMSPCSFPSALKNRHIWPPARDGRPGAPGSLPSLPQTPVWTPFPASRNENYVKRPMLLPCRQRPKSKNSKLSQEAAQGAGKTAAKTPPPTPSKGSGGPGGGAPLWRSWCTLSAPREPGRHAWVVIPICQKRKLRPESRSPCPPPPRTALCSQSCPLDCDTGTLRDGRGVRRRD